MNVALRDPKVKRTRGELHMMARKKLMTRDESVKGEGVVLRLWKLARHHKGPQIRYIDKFMCS